ncbi:MAG: RNA polymerase factor sigma-54 [Sphaerochaeta sp.]|jgi:RNA polymerase sigma-54 factor|uniref:RNA polymerase sigma-54 factor n=1 Tax=bioreactor metagenome TaxID=1076179 RepID=A0A644WUB0_9ZZZZ|nr:MULTISPECIES: RNA polymerase factor sigma-54 [Sphaerochaeta]MDT3360218.1 RNA polymerase factor sigma-54 [Spirochaetota bacterium]MDD2394772.1 RNA polymerase factor sigma-54 [Sphaerochaeta sp.]MDD4037159.1 RNA polymerase factor sigma-54 [Sphaerochaeta sp.]MDD4450992.1 RNA polymerase factor sigma-54 [Sphaerochaeta sp.]MEA5028399.1 RNA polymerase factor sigma-54 [Sphaerochaeta associata]
MEFSPHLSLSQKQQLKLSPQLLQSFELMALPLAELQQKIKSEIESNPALELPSSWDFSYERFAQQSQQKESSKVDDTYSDSSSYGSDYGGGYDYEASDRQQKFMENALSEEETLQEHLLSQLGCESLSEEEYTVGQILITNIDANGFFLEDPHDILTSQQAAHLQKLLKILHQFEPAGVAVKDWRESLILQATLKGLKDEDLVHFKALVNDNLELMRAGKQSQVAKNLGIDEMELDALYSFLKTLTPFPGQGFASGPQQYVIPDLSIKAEDGELVLSMNNSSLPDLRVSADFEALAQDLGNTDEAKKAQQYIQNQLKSANSLIFQIQVRNQTLYRLAQVLLVQQRDFFLFGPQYIKPLTQKEVAAQIGVHETTVSRISTAKWIDTDWGIISVKKLFSNAVGDEGAELSKQAAKETIRQILEEHQGQKALSDQKISDILKERGISVARRTVAKYRNELNIDPSFIRGTN